MVSHSMEKNNSNFQRYFYRVDFRRSNPVATFSEWPICPLVCKVQTLQYMTNLANMDF